MDNCRNSRSRRRACGTGGRASSACFLVVVTCLLWAGACQARNLVIFVADGLRPSSVNAVDAPTLTALKQRGVYFANSHAVFPTVTMANAATIATGHPPGDTGIFSNNPWIGYSSFNGGNFSRPAGSPTPFLESDHVLADLADHYGGNPLPMRTLLSVARGAGFSTVAIGKLGPTGMQDVTQLAPQDGHFGTPQTLFIDDATGGDGLPLPAKASTVLRDAQLPATAPLRLQPSGSHLVPGTRNANWGQQVYFIDSAVRGVLPQLRREGHPFVLVYWSRDPDGTQHNQGDSLNSLWPGVNGDTSALAVRNADQNLKLLLDWLDADAAVAADTDIVVTSDHGFATLGKRAIDAALHPTGSPAARSSYVDVPPGFLPAGFLALDLARHLELPLYDPDMPGRNEHGAPVYRRIDVASEHSVQGSGLLGGTGAMADLGEARLIVTANGGADSIYVLHDDPQLLRSVVTFLTRQDYVGALFVNDKHGALAGALPMSGASLTGRGKLPEPDVVVALRSFALSEAQTGVAEPTRRVVQISDSPLQQGQGMHGGLGRESTWNFMLAVGPDFRRGWVDELPVGNGDVAPTALHLLGLSSAALGDGAGRVLSEALVAGAPPADTPQRCVDMADPAADGRRTILHYQLLAGRRYLDDAEYRVPSTQERSGCRNGTLRRSR
jgi:arylsulfatase A-like enzyme